MNYEGLWWASGGVEAGWGINFAHQGDVIFATWFTYDTDGSGLWLDGQMVIDNDGLHGKEERSIKIPLKKGFHGLRLAYFNGSGDGDLSLEYSIEGSGKQPVPDSFFYQSVK